MKALCKKDDVGLYYSFKKGVFYNYKINVTLVEDDFGNTYFYHPAKFKEYFYTEKELRKIKLQKIYASSL